MSDYIVTNSYKGTLVYAKLARVRTASSRLAACDPDAKDDILCVMNDDK